MADAAVEFLLENLKQTVLQYHDVFKDNKICDRLDYLISQLERAHEIPQTDHSDLVNHLNKVERLTEAYLKSFFLSKTNIYYKLKFNFVVEPRYALKLQKIGEFFEARMKPSFIGAGEFAASVLCRDTDESTEASEQLSEAPVLCHEFFEARMKRSFIMCGDPYGGATSGTDQRAKARGWLSEAPALCQDTAEASERAKCWDTDESAETRERLTEAPTLCQDTAEASERIVLTSALCRDTDESAEARERLSESEQMGDTAEASERMVLAEAFKRMAPVRLYHEITLCGGLLGDATSTAADEQSLPAYLRNCVNYFNLFPPDVDVPARRLIVLWVAQGLVDPNENDNESSLEQTAERYLRELIGRSVVVVKRNRCEKVKSCRVADGRRQALLAQHDVKIRHLVDSNGSVGHSFIKIHGNSTVFNSVKKYQDVISFLSFNAEEGRKPGQDIGDFLHKCILSGSFIWLRFLDLERVFRPKLSETLGRLISLKYLGLRWTYLEHLPHSVHRLIALQVLDVKHTYITVLPRSIWRMQYLRHLYLSEAYRTRFPDPPSKITLSSLQTLWGAFVDEGTCVVGGLDAVRGIRKLGLSCMTRETKAEHMVKQLKAIDGWISQLESLETLRLKSRDEEGAPADLHLTSLEKNTKLSTLYLLGKLKADFAWSLPLSLTDVTLSGSELNFDPMPYLGTLPLVTLRLLAQSVVFHKMHCSASGFRELKFLWIWKLNNLKEFEAEEGSLPCLKELEIRSCDKLESLPDHLQNVRNLSIILTSMPTEFVDKTKANYAQVVFVPEDQYTLTN